MVAGFSSNDFHACNGTLVGAEHLHRRMEALSEGLIPAVADLDPDLVPIISPLHTASGFKANPNRPRDHACLYFVDRRLKKSPFPRLPQLGIYLHRTSLSIGFYSGWWKGDALRSVVSDPKPFRGLVPRKGYRCLGGDVIVESPERSLPWAPARLKAVDRSLFVGKIYAPNDAEIARPEFGDHILDIFADLHRFYRVFTEARKTLATTVVYPQDPSDPALVRDALTPKEAELLLDLHRFAELSEFRIQPDMLFNLYLCLKTKPFLILAGISGTGKSTVVRLFAEALNGTTEGRANGYRLIPVRPDWHDTRDLLGFENLLTGTYRPGALLHAIQDALEAPDRPYFVCLDEMNLARVEHYFSDFLSILETARRTPDGNWTTDPIELAQGPDQIDAEGLGPLPSRLPLPSNLYVAGTVNMDETTYTFSPKVLDRANTVAFDRVDLSLPPEAPDTNIDSGALKALGPALLDRPYRRLADVRHRDDVTAWNENLKAINTILAGEDLHFAYRIREEILLYMAYALDLIESLPAGSPPFTPEDAFDYQILQKILPRLTGTGEEAAEILDALIRTCDPSFPRAAHKLHRMNRRLERTGFTSFW